MKTRIVRLLALVSVSLGLLQLITTNVSAVEVDEVMSRVDSSFALDLESMAQKDLTITVSPTTVPLKRPLTVAMLTTTDEMVDERVWLWTTRSIQVCIKDLNENENNWLIIVLSVGPDEGSHATFVGTDPKGIAFEAQAREQPGLFLVAQEGCYKVWPIFDHIVKDLPVAYMFGVGPKYAD